MTWQYEPDPAKRPKCLHGVLIGVHCDECYAAVARAEARIAAKRRAP